MKILVADDEPVVLGVVDAILRNDGHEVLKASTGLEAMRICAEMSSEIDLVISDIRMPGMTGRELAHCLSKGSPPIPVILMSGYMEGSDSVMHLVRDGRLDNSRFLQKPFSAKDLLRMVREHDRGAIAGATSGR